MGHIPHLYLPGPWVDSVISLDDGQLRHVEKVLRLTNGAQISYTDGIGLSGLGTLERGAVERGSESRSEMPPDISIYLAPPKSRDRQRYAIEKLCELAVRRVGWLQTAYTEGRPPKREKAEMWAISALEQSRGSWLTTVDGYSKVTDVLESGVFVVVADPDGPRAHESTYPVILLVGPEAGWAPREIPSTVPKLALAQTILRTDTAAIVGAAHLIGGHHRK